MAPDPGTGSPDVKVAFLKRLKPILVALNVLPPSPPPPSPLL